MLKFIKYIYIAILALFIMGGCTHDELLETPLTQDEIVFAAASGKVTRAGEASLAKYIENFRIYGTNTKNDKNSLVFNNYVLWYDEERTQSNTSNWEYVGYDPVDNKLQTIKYWDFSAFPYMFWAIAGAGWGNFTVKDEKDRIASFNTPVEEVDGSMPSLYYTKPTVITKDQYTDPVTFQFFGAHSRIRFAFYETVPGYAVKNVKFYIDTDEYTECAVNGKFNIRGNLSFTYDYTDEDEPGVNVGFLPSGQAAYHTFGNLNYTKAATGWLAQNGGSDYLGVLTSAPTYAGNVDIPGYYTCIIPYPENETPLSINVDYTLVSLDRSGQEIEITGAKATVPVQFCQWKSNYSYTYLFKITDSDLSPITFEAYGEIDNTTNNEQGTITTVNDYSITTHQDGDVDENGIIYESSPYIADPYRPIWISVVKNGPTTSATEEIVLNEGTDDYVCIYHQETAKEWVVETGTENPVETINYANGMANFSPTETGTYRIEYWHKEGEAEPEKKSVKIVSIGALLNSEGHYGTDLGNGGSDGFEMK